MCRNNLPTASTTVGGWYDNHMNGAHMLPHYASVCRRMNTGLHRSFDRLFRSVSHGLSNVPNQASHTRLVAEKERSAGRT